MIQAVIQYLQDEFDYSFIWLGLYHSKAHTLVGQGGVVPTSERTILTQKLTLEPGELLEQVVVQKRLIGVPDLQDVPQAGRLHAIARKLNIQGTIIFPIRHCEDCLGVAVLGSSRWGIPAHADDKARLSMILGELGTALHHLQIERQQQQRSEQPINTLLSVLSELHQIEAVEERLALLVRESHQFLLGDRTHLYWFSPEQRTFWRWIGQPGDRRQPEPAPEEDRSPQSVAPGMAAIRQSQAILPSISMDAIGGFYSHLLSDDVVSISEADSSLKANTAQPLMDQMGAKSLLAVPIMVQGELLGFLAVTEKQPRLWSSDDKQYLQGAGKLAALVAPLLDLEQSIASIRQDQELAAGICQAICHQEDWHQVLGQCASQVQQRFGADRFLVLTYSEHRENFEIAYQNTASSQYRVIKGPLSPLSDLDWSLLERTQGAIAIEDLDHDLKFMDWRTTLVSSGIRSFLVCPVTLNKPSNGLVIIAHHAPHHWVNQDKSLGQTISQQVGVILRQWHLNDEVKKRQSIHQAIHRSLSVIQKAHHLGEMETDSMRRMMDLMDVPLVALVPWMPGQTTVQIPPHLVITNSTEFAINTEVTIAIASDALMQWALQSEEVLSLSIEQLTPETRQWLTGRRIGQILVEVLRTDPDHAPLGLVLVADVAERFWSNYQLEVLEVIGRQLAWSRRYLMLTEKLMQQQAELKQLNWYKHRSLEKLCLLLTNDVKRLNASGPGGSSSSGGSTRNGDVSGMRVQQVIRQMSQRLVNIHPMLKHEQWQLAQNKTSVALISLLKRVLTRVDPLIRQRQLWTKVHNELNLNVMGDIAKTELVIYELLAAACRRSPKQGNLDIWSRSIDFDWLELSITDHGKVSPQLLSELQQGSPFDWLAQSWLESSPGLELAICQSIVQQIGGKLNFYALEDGRMLSQMTLRIDNRSGSSEGDLPSSTQSLQDSVSQLF
ncbi:MAG: GAF domain-containing protein [Cyanothece sp. SIO2G6]|nr:GAF domain-containing protein [Cyanothece sp. SIO2G6]